MNYILDTNVISELFKRQPHPGVARWVRRSPPHSLYISVLTLGEMRKGVDAMEEGVRKASILKFLDGEHKNRFEGRVLPVDARVAGVWGAFEARSSRTLPTIDALLAATALAHEMVLVTRNTRDFEITGLRVLNPWMDGGNGPSNPLMAKEPRAPYRAPKKTGAKRRKINRRTL